MNTEQINWIFYFSFALAIAIMAVRIYFYNDFINRK